MSSTVTSTEDSLGTRRLDSRRQKNQNWFSKPNSISQAGRRGRIVRVTTSATSSKAPTVSTSSTGSPTASKTSKAPTVSTSSTGSPTSSKTSKAPTGSTSSTGSPTSSKTSKAPTGSTSSTGSPTSSKTSKAPTGSTSSTGSPTSSKNSKAPTGSISSTGSPTSSKTSKAPTGSTSSTGSPTASKTSKAPTGSTSSTGSPKASKSSKAPTGSISSTGSPTASKNSKSSNSSTGSPAGSVSSKASKSSKSSTGSPTQSPTQSPTGSTGTVVSGTHSPTVGNSTNSTDGGNTGDGTRWVSPACQAFENGDVYQTNVRADISYLYELQRRQGTDLASVLGSLEGKIVSHLGEEVLNCTSSRRRLESSLYPVAKTFNRRRLQTVGIDMDPPDTASNDFCSEVLQDATCTVINGDFSLYLQDDSASTSKRGAAEEALAAIKSGMTNGDFNDDNIIKVHYLGADLSGIEGGKTGGGTDTTSRGSVPSGATEQIQISDDSKKLSAMGISLITLGFLGILLLAMIVMRKKRETRYISKIDEKYLEDEGSIITKQSQVNFMKFNESDNETVSTAGSSPCWRKTRSAHVYGEDDSVLSRPTRLNSGSILAQLRALELLGKLEEPGPLDHVDVHHCTSSMCNTCINKNGTTFVASSYSSTAQSEFPTSISQGTREYHTEDTVEF